MSCQCFISWRSRAKKQQLIPVYITSDSCGCESLDAFQDTFCLLIFFSTLGFQTPCFWRYLDPKTCPKHRTSAGIWKTRGIDRSLNVSSQIIRLWVLPSFNNKNIQHPQHKNFSKKSARRSTRTWKYFTAPNPSLLGRAALLGCILGIPEKSAALLVAAGGRRAPEIPQPVIGTRRVK